MKNRTLTVFLVLAVILGTASAAVAGGIKERMKSRLPAIKALKAQGVVGENNQGFLSFVGGAAAGKDVVDAENADRRKVYGAIARQQGTTAALVGQRRALQIADTAAPGTPLQNAGGKWYKK